MTVCGFRDNGKALTDPDAYFRRGNAHSNLAHYPQARDDMQKVIELDPTNALAHNNLGVANLCLGNFDKAVQNTTDAIHLDPDYRDAFHNRALARTETGDLHRALADFTRAIDLEVWPKSGRKGLYSWQSMMGESDLSREAYGRPTGCT